MPFGNTLIRNSKLKIILLLILLPNYVSAKHTRGKNLTEKHQTTNGYINEKQEDADVNYDLENPYPPIGAAGDDTIDYFSSYDSDYSGPRSRTNVSAFFYDTDNSNSDIFPNPEMMVYDNPPNEGAHMSMFTDPLQLGIMDNIKLPDNSLADADLKDHNLIDSVNYVYGIANTSSTKKDWMFIILITRILAITISAATLVALLCATSFETFRKRSKMYPLELNLLASLLACNVLYLTAIVDTKSGARCEITAILLHYAHIVCCAWFLVQCKAIASWANDTKYSLDIKYVYFFTYGMPAVFVTIFYALSMEKYETNNYCWMSVENGMLLGCMLPVCIFIMANTIFAIVGQRSLSRKKTEIITSKIHEMLNQEMAPNMVNTQGVIEPKQLDDMTLRTLDCFNDNHSDLNQPRCSQTDSMGMDVNFRGSTEMVEVNLEMAHMTTNKSSMKIDLASLSLDNLSWKSVTTKEMDSLKSCLTFCLILQPLFCVSWFMGVIALENCQHWLTPSIFLLLSTFMYLFIAFHFFTAIHIICDELIDCESGETPENVQVQSQSRQHPTPLQQRSMDNIPLLVSNVTPSTAPVIPADAISTISI